MQKKESKISVSLIAMFVVVALIIAMAFLTNAESVQQTAWSLVPPIIAIALALITKEVYVVVSLLFKRSPVLGIQLRGNFESHLL